MLTRDELRRLKCWGCWWQEAGRCNNERVEEVAIVDGKRVGHEITIERAEGCPKKDYVSKRAVLAQYFDKDS